MGELATAMDIDGLLRSHVWVRVTCTSRRPAAPHAVDHVIAAQLWICLA